MNENLKIYDDFLKQMHRIDARALALSDSMLNILEALIGSVIAESVKLEMRYLDDELSRVPLVQKQQFLQEQAQFIKDVVYNTYNSSIQNLINNALLDGMTYTAEQTTSLLNGVLNIDLEAKAVTLPQVISYQKSMLIDGSTIQGWLSRMEATSAQRITQAARQALLQGMSIQKAASLMRSQGVEGTRPQIQALARTTLMSGANTAREDAVAELGKDLDYQWRYVSTLDGRTCPICGKDDGKVFGQDELRPSLPRHVNCRCVYVPFFEGFPPYTRPATKHSEKVVNHRDGSSSTKFSVDSSELTTETYNVWLRRQLKEDPTFVRSILGKTRFELYSQGKLSLNKMVTDNRIKNLSEL